MKNSCPSRKKWSGKSEYYYPPFLPLANVGALGVFNPKRRMCSSRTRRFDLPAALVATASLLIDKRVRIQSTLIGGDDLRNFPNTRDTRLYKRWTQFACRFKSDSRESLVNRYFRTLCRSWCVLGQRGRLYERSMIEGCAYMCSIDAFRHVSRRALDWIHSGSSDENSANIFGARDEPPIPHFP